MAGVIINEFEAVAEAAPAAKSESGGGAAPTKIEMPHLRAPLRRLEARAARLRAH